jgi:tetratricopeptide (TPR) repeat protein
MKLMNGNPYLCSFHIPKTGGTTFASHARQSLGADEFVLHGPFARVDRFFNNQPQMEELSDSQKRHIRIVHGHGAGLALAEAMRGRAPEFMVIMREPFARFVSGFHHYNNERSSSGRELISEERYFEKRSQNFFARLLRKYFRQLAPPNGDLTIEGLMPVLQSFKYILVTEYLDQQLPQIFSHYGLKSTGIRAQRVNTSKSDLGVDPEAFDRLNAVDRLIYSTLVNAGGSGATLENPFGYSPDRVQAYLESAWSAYTCEAQLVAAYDGLVDACKKTLKLQAAFFKLNSGATSHVSDRQLLLERVTAALSGWLQDLDKKDLSVANFWSGTVLVKEGDRGAAEEHFREAIRLNPRNDSALAHLAKLLHKKGNKTEASMLLGRASELRPERPMIQALRKVFRM